MIVVGDPVPLVYNDPNRATDLYVRARVWNASGTEVSGSPFTLAHVANGLYRSLSLVMPNTPHLTFQVQAFTDSGFTTPYGATADGVFFKQLESGSGAEFSDAVFERLIGVVSGDEITGKVQEAC